MSDDIDSGPIVSGEVAPAPSETPRTPSAPDAQSREQIVKEQFSMGLGLAAHGTEDATDYVKERKTQEKFLNDEDLTGAQMREWHERSHSAVQRAVDAAARARGEVPPSQQQAPQEIPGYVAPDDPNYDAHMASATERFTAYFDGQQRIGEHNTVKEHKDTITSWLNTFDPQSRLTGYLMASPLGPAMAEAWKVKRRQFSILQICRRRSRRERWPSSKASPRQADDGSEGGALQAPQPRRMTQAPPPITPPRGGANPPKDLQSLARKDSSGGLYQGSICARATSARNGGIMTDYFDKIRGGTTIYYGVGRCQRRSVGRDTLR